MDGYKKMLEGMRGNDDEVDGVEGREDGAA